MDKTVTLDTLSDPILDEAQKAYDADQNAVSESYEKSRQDLLFLSDEKFAQWEQADYNSRIETGRPALTIDQLGQFVHQVVNDIRMNTPAINVIPDDSDATVEVAEVYQGLIRNIEYRSSADEVYDTAANFSVKCGQGYIRVDHDYSDDDSFDQDLKICRVINPLAVFMDRSSVEVDGRDMMRCTILQKMSKAEYQARWPDKLVSSFDSKAKSYDNALDDEEVTVAEYFKIIEKDRKITPDAEGKSVDYSDDTAPDAKSRTVKKRIVMRYMLSGQDVLEETVFPGKYIPVVPVFGEESWMDGKRHVFSLIRKSKEAQRMYNYWKSLETELIQKMPQAPVMVPEGQIDDYMADWKDPSKAMALRYKTKDVDGQPFGQAPQRLEPPTIPTGIVNASRETVDDIKATLGMYNASIGQKSNETSGIAINARKTEGDVATYHFSDNLVRAITQVGRILVNAIPEIYDTARVVRTLGLEDEPKMVGINGAVAPDGSQPETFNLAAGRFQVKVTTGASFTTKRQEAAQYFSDIVSKMPELMGVMGDLLFKNMDFPGAQAMAERMKKVIEAKNPGLIEDENQPGGQPAPDPQKMQMQQMIQQLQQALQAAQGELKSKDAELQIKQQDAQTNQMKVQVDAQDKQQTNQLKAADLMLSAKDLEIKEQQVAGQLAQAQEALDGKIQTLTDMMKVLTDNLSQSTIGSSTADLSGTSPTATNGVNNGY